MREFVLSGDWKTKEVKINGAILDPKYSQAIHNHSPDGFAWGYEGSGPAQLALSLCLLVYSKEEAIKRYQEFKRAHIASIPQSNFCFVLKI